MRHYTILILGVSGLLLWSNLAIAQGPESPGDPAQGFCRFVDEDGDGFNDLAPDADGDGIPNGLDPDYVRPEGGVGNQHQHSWSGTLFNRMFGLAQMYQNEQMHGPQSGPGVNSGFGPGESMSHGSSGGENQAEQAGRRGGRR